MANWFGNQNQSGGNFERAYDVAYWPTNNTDAKVGHIRVKSKSSSGAKIKVRAKFPNAKFQSVKEAK